MQRSLFSVSWLALLAVTLPSLAMAQPRENSSASTAGAEAGSAKSATEASERTAESPPTAAAEKSSLDSAAAEAAPDATTAAAPAPPPAPPQPVAAVSSKTEPPATTTSDIGIQRVPTSGYPTYKTRGIYGGSLWWTFHGLQWPYMPQKSGEPALMLGLSGYGWVDTAYVDIKAGTPNEPSQKNWRQQGRFAVRVTPTYRKGNWFIQGQAELIANSDQTQARDIRPDTDDLWLRAGRWNSFDVQVGRFEAWEIYHLGMGLDINTFERTGATINTSSYNPPDFYGATFAYPRSNGAGNVAGHVYFTDWLRLEALTRVGNSGGLSTLGERAALVFDVGFLKLKAAGEYLEGEDPAENMYTRSRQQGGAVAAQFIYDPLFELGANGAYGMQDSWDTAGILSEPATWTKYSWGGFANVHIYDELLVGGGLNYTHFQNAHPDPAGKVGATAQTQIFGAVQYGLWRQLFLKAVFGYADADFINIAFDNTPPFHRKMLSGRLRASFYF